jgi:hypothetical protein
VPSVGAAVYTDDWCMYESLPGHGRRHASVNHTRSVWARDIDGDGDREVHDNTLEAIGTGLREYLQPFRGANTVYLAMFRRANNLKAVPPGLLRTPIGVSKHMV